MYNQILFINKKVFWFFYNFAHESVFLDNIIIFFAEYFPYVVIILAGLFLLFHHDVLKAEYPYQIFFKKKKEILSVFITACVAWGIASFLKILIHIPRPQGISSVCLPNGPCDTYVNSFSALVSATGFSFPSGHATFFMALAFSIYFLHKKIGYWFMLAALLIGMARIAAGVHYPVDILAGFGLGALVAYLVKVYRMR